MYNTETAKSLDSCTAGLSVNDLSYWDEELFIKKTGEYFLLGTGNAASKYSERVSSNTWGGTSKIIPLSEDQAKEWAEDNLSADEYITIFGAVEE